MNLINEMYGWKIRWLAVVKKIRIINNTDDENRLMTELTILRNPMVLGFVNSHAMNSIVEGMAFFNALYSADILLRDGSGISMLFKRFKVDKGLNMNGTDFIPKLLEAYRGRRVAFWGTQPPYLDTAVMQAQAKYGVVVASAHHGFDTEQAYVDLAVEHQPDLIVLGMGMPKQEKIAAMIREQQLPVLVVCGGAIIDFMGDKIKRAPQWMRLMGIEWIYRLALEPKRLYKRYVLGNPIFMYRVLQMQRADLINFELPT